jgi:predicted small lipoprotein YifL
LLLSDAFCCVSAYHAQIMTNRLINAMKNTGFALYLLCSLLYGCGQPGPLYLPTSKPPIYVEPDAEPETKNTVPKQEIKPQSPPQPETKQPAKDQ